MKKSTPSRTFSWFGQRAPMLAAALLVLLICGSALAHTFFLQSTRYRLQKPGSARMFVGWGHLLPLHDPMHSKKLARLELLKPDDTRQQIPITEGAGVHLYKVRYEKPGCYLLYGETNPGYYTVYVGQDDKVHHHVGPMDEIEDAKRITFSVRCWQYAKAVVVVGEESEPEGEHVCPARRPLGVKFEIVPAVCPRKLAVGDRFTFDVLFDGEPVPGDDVRFNATYLGYSTAMEDFLYPERPVVQGKGFFDICRPGVWYVEVEHKVPSPPDYEAKCKHFLYHATLVFEVPRRQAAAASGQ